MSKEDNKDGYIDRLAKSLFASPGSPISEFADNQRAERLASCRYLESIVKECQRQSRNNSDLEPFESTPDKAVATTKSRIRITRFFNWNSPHGDDGSSNNLETEQSVFQDEPQLGSSSNKSKFSSGCNKETHELWACRALSLGCGNHLSDLRRCWNDDAFARLADRNNDDLKVDDEGHSCRGIQQNMAKCVTKNASELAERIQARKKKQQS